MICVYSELIILFFLYLFMFQHFNPFFPVFNLTADSERSLLTVPGLLTLPFTQVNV